MLDKAIDTLVFDLDNTLIDRNQAMHNVMENWLQQHPNPDCTLEDIIEQDAYGYSDRLGFCAWLLKTFDSESTRSFTPSTLLSFIHKQVVAQLSPDPAVLQLLTTLQHRFRLVLASNGSGDTQRAKLQQTALAPFFEPGRAFISGEMEYEKPDPLFFTALLAQLNIHSSQAMMIGDHPVNDILAAQQAGLSTCWIAHGRTHSFSVIPTLTIDQITVWNQ